MKYTIYSPIYYHKGFLVSKIFIKLKRIKKSNQNIIITTLQAYEPNWLINNRNNPRNGRCVYNYSSIKIIRV